MNRRLRPLAALAMVALTVAGCSDTPAETGTASSGGNKRDTNRDKATKFAACMRDSGVSEFPDPDASGELTVDGVLNGSSLDPDSPAWKQAIGACRDLQPPGFTGDEEVTDEEQKVRLQFAQCMRDNGVEDFPDPAKGDPLVDTRRIPSAADNMAAINAAMRTCRDFAAEAIGR
jgi:hypothetical protein